MQGMEYIVAPILAFLLRRQGLVGLFKSSPLPWAFSLISEFSSVWWRIFGQLSVLSVSTD